MSWINIPLDKSIKAMTNLIMVGSEMSKKRQDRAIRLIKNILILLVLFLVALFAAYGHFIRGHPLW